MSEGAREPYVRSSPATVPPCTSGITSTMVSSSATQVYGGSRCGWAPSPCAVPTDCSRTKRSTSAPSRWRITLAAQIAP